jgi:radical SAM superfamily enzyme YgiQ (UPF0313 family)
MEKAVESGLRSLFVGFETLNPNNLKLQHKYQNLDRDYSKATHRLHDLGVMVNASFVFGMEEDDFTVFGRTVEWAIQQGIETATFHILTPYPGTVLHENMIHEGRMITSNWDLYDTRHTVFSPMKMTPEILEAGYWHAYDKFYKWSNIFRSGFVHNQAIDIIRHIAYSAGWKKFEPLWDWVIRAKRVTSFLPLLESVLAGFGSHQTRYSPYLSLQERTTKGWR